jgi:Fe-S-cluster containining protein
MCCSIYEIRPSICRKFEMDSLLPRCARHYADRNARGIPLTL